MIIVYSIKHKLTFHAALFQVSSYVDINSLEVRHTHTCIPNSWRKVISKNLDNLVYGPCASQFKMY